VNLARQRLVQLLLARIEQVDPPRVLGHGHGG
jgi:hypothetical protein